MNMSKYPSLPNSELIPSKMAKLQGLEKYLLWRHTDPIEALNLEIYNFLKNLHQHTPGCQIRTFYLEKYQSYKAFHVSHYDVMQALNLKTNNIFEKKQVKITHVTKFWVYTLRNIKVTRPL